MLARGGLTLGRPWALSYLYQQAFAFFIFNDVLVFVCSALETLCLENQSSAGLGPWTWWCGLPGYLAREDCTAFSAVPQVLSWKRRTWSTPDLAACCLCRKEVGSVLRLRRSPGFPPGQVPGG